MAVPYVSFEQSRGFDKYLVEECHFAIQELVEMAACSIARAIVEERVVESFQKTTVFCGSGNNGADGLRVAVHLRSLGYNVDVYLPQEAKNPLNKVCASFLIPRQCYCNAPHWTSKLCLTMITQPI